MPMFYQKKFLCPCYVNLLPSLDNHKCLFKQFQDKLNNLVAANISLPFKNLTFDAKISFFKRQLTFS